MNPERRDYRHDTLTRDRLLPNPVDQFQRWYGEAIAARLDQPNAMVLSTIGSDGGPDSRIVLLKDHGPAGFAFYTNLQSSKALQLQSDPRASIVFHWNAHERQVRLRGHVVAHEADAADAYFEGRPRGAQLGAWASAQSSPLVNRSELAAALADAAARFPPDTAIPRPPFWGGLRLVPAEFEFWQGRVSRLHDRFRYRQEGAGWHIDRLAP